MSKKPIQNRSPFIYVTPQLRQISYKYRVPIEVIASVRLDPEYVARAYRCSYDKQYFDLVASSGEVTIFGRPVGFSARRFNHDVWITLHYPTSRILWIMNAERFAKRSVDEWYRRLSDWLLVRAELRRIRLSKKTVFRAFVAKKVAFIRVEEDVEGFKHLVEKLDGVSDDPIVDACLLALRYNPKLLSPDAKATILLRVFPLVATEPIHGVELSQAGTGKTTVAVMYKLALRWLYFNKPPSPPTLVGDARTGRTPIAGAEGVWFDEVDKWASKREKLQDVNELVEVLLTGMEQGLWTREKGGEKRPEVVNPIPCYFSGNIGFVTNPREVIRKIIERASGEGASKAFDERITYAVAVKADVAHEVQRSVLPTIPKPSILRGMVRYLRERYASTPDPKDSIVPKGFKGRYRRSVIRMMKVLSVLYDEPLDDGYIIEASKNLVRGVIIG